MIKKQTVLLASALLLAACGGGGGSSGDDPGFSTGENYHIKVSSDKNILFPASISPIYSDSSGIFYSGQSVQYRTDVNYTIENGNGSFVPDGTAVNITLIEGREIAGLLCNEADNSSCWGTDDNDNTVQIPSTGIADLSTAGGFGHFSVFSDAGGTGDVRVRISLTNAQGTESAYSDVILKIGYGSENANSIILSGASIPTNSSGTLTGAVLDETANLIPDDNNNNVIVNVISAPVGSTLSGQNAADDFVEGSNFAVSTRDGLAIINVAAGSRAGNIQYQMITDRLDNNVDNGVSEPIVASGLVTIGSGSSNIVTIATSNLSDATINVAYSNTISASGGSGTITFFINSGSLPAGLILDTNGTIQGTPTVSGEFNFTVLAQDSEGDADTKAFDLLVIGDGIITFTSPADGDTLNTATQGFGYTQSFVVSGATNPVFSIQSGALPTGLTLDESGVISGTVTASAGDYDFTISVIDDDANIAEASFILPVVSGEIAISTTSLDDATVATGYSATIEAAGSDDYSPSSPITWSISSGSLPDGLVLISNGLTAVISGTPTTEGVSTFVLKVVDANGIEATQILSIVVIAEEEGEVEVTP